MTDALNAQPEVRRNEAENRYEAWLEGEPLGYLFYRQEDGRTVFLHTDVREEAEGRGIGRALVRSALDDVRAGGGQAVPMCPFLAAYVKTHREYQDLVPPAYDKLIGRTRS